MQSASICSLRRRIISSFEQANALLTQWEFIHTNPAAAQVQGLSLCQRYVYMRPQPYQCGERFESCTVTGLTGYRKGVGVGSMQSRAFLG